LTGVSDLRSRLAAIEAALDAGTYRPGPWQSLLEDASCASPEELAELAESVTRVSDKLHRRVQRTTFPFERALAVEILGALGGLLVLTVAGAAGSALGFVAAAVLLGVTLQPLLKTATGLGLGVRYSYGYLRRGEPRFKLDYGSYLCAAPWKRIVLHASGALGSPLAWFLVSVVSAPSRPGLAAVLFWLGALHLLFQAALLLLAALGTRRVPVLGTLRLTSAGGAGWELRQRIAVRRST
jgi:hypothetical protein